MPAHAAQAALQDQLQSQSRSLPSVASGLRLWHAYAVTVLNYVPEHSLPPQSSQDVVKFIALFCNAGAAANHISYLRWACVLHGLSLQWHTGQIAMALKGLKKQSSNFLAGVLPQPNLFDEHLVLQLMTLCNSLPGHSEVGTFFFAGVAISAWGPSEAVRIENLCRAAPAVTRPGHRLLSSSGGWQPGHRITLLTVTPSQLLTKLRRLLAMLLIAAPERYRWKGFRAGKASCMAAAGQTQPLPQSLQAGEWRSAAVLSYVDPEYLDAAAFWQEISDDEE